MPEGTNDVAVNTPIAMILAEGEDAAALKDGKPPARKAKAEPDPVLEQRVDESRPRVEEAEALVAPASIRSPPVRSPQRRPKPTCRKAPRW